MAFGTMKEWLAGEHLIGRTDLDDVAKGYQEDYRASLGKNKMNVNYNDVMSKLDGRFGKRAPEYFKAIHNTTRNAFQLRKKATNEYEGLGFVADAMGKSRDKHELYARDVETYGVKVGDAVSKELADEYSMDEKFFENDAEAVECFEAYEMAESMFNDVVKDKPKDEVSKIMESHLRERYQRSSPLSMPADLARRGFSALGEAGKITEYINARILQGKLKDINASTTVENVYDSFIKDVWAVSTLDNLQRRETYGDEIQTGEYAIGVDGIEPSVGDARFEFLKSSYGCAKQLIAKEIEKMQAQGKGKEGDDKDKDFASLRDENNRTKDAGTLANLSPEEQRKIAEKNLAQ